MVNLLTGWSLDSFLSKDLELEQCGISNRSLTVNSNSKELGRVGTGLATESVSCSVLSFMTELKIIVKMRLKDKVQHSYTHYAKTSIHCKCCTFLSTKAVENGTWSCLTVLEGIKAHIRDVISLLQSTSMRSEAYLAYAVHFEDTNMQTV